MVFQDKENRQVQDMVVEQFGVLNSATVVVLTLGEGVLLVGVLYKDETF